MHLLGQGDGPRDDEALLFVPARLLTCWAQAAQHLATLGGETAPRFERTRNQYLDYDHRGFSHCQACRSGSDFDGTLPTSAVRKVRPSATHPSGGIIYQHRVEVNHEQRLKNEASRSSYPPNHQQACILNCLVRAVIRKRRMSSKTQV